MAFRLLSAIKNQQVHSLMGNVISAFFNLLSFAILVRILPESEFGEWVFLISSYTILDQVRTALLQSGIIKFYAGQAHEIGRTVLGAAWYIALLVSIVPLIIGFILPTVVPQFFDNTWRLFSYWLGPMLLVSLPFNFASWVLQATHKFDKIVQIRIVQNGCFLVLISILFLLKMVTLPNILYAYTISLGFASIYCITFKWAHYSTVIFRTKQQVKELIVYGRFIVGSMLTSGMINYSNIFIIRTMLNPAAVAIFNIPQKFMEVIEIILRSFVATAQPTLSAAVNRNDWREVARAFCRYTGAVTLLILPFIFGMIILVKPLIIILAKSTYLSATNIVIIALLSTILYPIDRLLGVTLDMINKPKINFYKNTLRLVINIIGDVLFIWIFKDVLAVAAVSVLSLIAGILYGYYCLKRYVDINLKDIANLGWMESKILVNKILAKVKLTK